MKTATLQFLSQIVSLSNQPMYLVGGSVRDLLIGVPNIKDIDLKLQFRALFSNYLYSQETVKLTGLRASAMVSTKQLQIKILFTSPDKANPSVTRGRKAAGS